MKTNFFYAAALLILTAAILAAPVSSARAQSGADTPQVLGNKILEGIKAKNKDALRSLIHPQFIAYNNNGNTGELDIVIDNMLSFQIPKNSEFVVVPLDQVSEYDKATQTFKSKEGTFYFPVAPSDLLVLATEVEIPKKDEKGVETKTKAKVPVMMNLISRYNGQWYIVLPVKKADEKQGEKTQ